MVTDAVHQLTPSQLIDAGRRAEADGRFDLAVLFYRHVTEHFADAAQAAEAHGALGRIGSWPPEAGNSAVSRIDLRHLASLGRERYRAGRALTRCLTLFGWLLILAGPGSLAAYCYHRIESVVLSPAELVPVASGAAASLLVGFGVLLATELARALFDQANAARDLVALERARQGLD